MNKPFQVGNRVAAYTEGNRYTGRVLEIQEGTGLIKVRLDSWYGDCTVHFKQCRRLVKRERRRIYVPKQDLDQGFHKVNAWHQPTPADPSAYIEFIEVLRKSSENK